MKNKAILFSSIIIVLFFLALITRNGNLALLNILFIAYFLTGIIRSPATEDIKLTAQRRVKKIITDRGITVEVLLILKNHGKKTLSLVMEDPFQKGMVLEEGNVKQCAAIRENASYEWSYTFTSTRGCYRWETLSVVVSDPSCCIESPLDLPAPAEIFLPPQYKKIRPLTIHPWETLSTPGIVSSRKSGNSTDFFGVREYHSGDPLRTLDWKRTARFRNKFFTREFQQENTADIAIVIDGRRTRELSINNHSIFESSIELAAGLSQMFLHQGQRLGFYLTGENPRSVLPSYGKKQLHKILNCLAAAEVGTDSSNDQLYTLPMNQFSTKTQLFILSPVDREDLGFYRHLRSLGLQIILICPDTYAFAISGELPEKQNPTSLKISQVERQCVMRIIAELSITVIDWIIGEPVESLIMKALSRRSGIKRI